MDKFGQLVDQSRTTLQRLERSSATAPALVQADTVLLPHGCSSLNDIFRPLSLADDPGLRRGVAARSGDGVAVRHAQTSRALRNSPPPQERSRPTTDRSLAALRSLSGTKDLLRGFAAHGDAHPAGLGLTLGASTMSLSPQEASRPRDRGVMATSSQGEMPAALPDSPRNRQIVQNLLKSAQQELEAAEKEASTHSRSLPFSKVPSVLSKKRMQSSPTIPASPERSRLRAGQGQSSSVNVPGTLPEGEKSGWFARHPLCKAAGASLLRIDTGQLVHGDDLKKWAAPQPTDPRRLAANKVPANTKSTGVAADVPSPSPSRQGGQRTDLATQKPQRHNSLSAESPGSRRTDTPPQPESRPPFFPEDTTLGPQLKLSPLREPSSQLEQLVRRWQGRAQSNNEEGAPAAVGTGSRGASGIVPPAPGPSSEPREGEPFAGARPGCHDSDHAFTETLARVLQREIRRYGMEEER